MNNFRKKILVSSLSVALLFFGGISTLAGTTWVSENIYLPGFNNSASTNYQTKATGGAHAGLRLHATAGTHPDVRTEGSNGNGSWVRNVMGGNTYSINSVTATKGNERLTFSSDLLEFQGVNLVLDWRSN